MTLVALWLGGAAVLIAFGALGYTVHVIGRYKVFMEKVAQDLIRVSATQKARIRKEEKESAEINRREANIGQNLEELKEWHSLLVRMLFEAGRVVESKLDEGFWGDLRRRYPHLKVFPVEEEKGNPEEEKGDSDEEQDLSGKQENGTDNP